MFGERMLGGIEGTLGVIERKVATMLMRKELTTTLHVILLNN